MNWKFWGKLNQIIKKYLKISKMLFFSSLLNCSNVRWAFQMIIKTKRILDYGMVRISILDHLFQVVRYCSWLRVKQTFNINSLNASSILALVNISSEIELKFLNIRKNIFILILIINFTISSAVFLIYLKKKTNNYFLFLIFSLSLFLSLFV